MSNIPAVPDPTRPVHVYPRNRVDSQHRWYLTRYYVTGWFPNQQLSLSGGIYVTYF